MSLVRIAVIILMAVATSVGDSSRANELQQGREKMIVTSSSEAESIVRARIISDPKHEFVIQNGQTQERDFGWVVFYTTRGFVETGNPSYLVPGTGPIAVMRDGEVVPLSSSVPPNIAVAIFEDEWRKAVNTNH